MVASATLSDALAIVMLPLYTACEFPPAEAVGVCICLSKLMPGSERGGHVSHRSQLPPSY